MWVSPGNTGGRSARRRFPERVGHGGAGGTRRNVGPQEAGARPGLDPAGAPGQRCQLRVFLSGEGTTGRAGSKMGSSGIRGDGAASTSR